MHTYFIRNKYAIYSDCRVSGLDLDSRLAKFTQPEFPAQ